MKLNVNVDLSVDVTLTKECNSCHEVKPLDAFNKKSNGKFGRRATCKVCDNAYTKMKRAEYTAANELLSMTEIWERTPEKKCQKCRNILPSVEFNRANNQKDGLQIKCRSCANTYKKMKQAEYKAENELLSFSEICGRTPEKKCHSCEKILPSVDFYRDSNQKDGLTAKCQTCSGEYTSQYAKDNPEKCRGWVAKRRALQLDLFLEDFTYSQIVERDGAEACCYCHTTEGPFEVDHIFPLNLGGWHTPDNLVLACASHNRSKGAVHPAIYIKREGHSPNETILRALALEHELTHSSTEEEAATCA